MFPIRLYMAPEILRYEKYDAKADLWSVGAVLYEMAVGKPPFRAQNHVELLKKIEHAKGIKFPDEDSQRVAEDSNPVIPVSSDIKALIRALLKRHPVERSTFDDFFGSTALARSKFPRPVERKDPSPPSATTAEEDAVNEDTSRNGKPWTGQPIIPEHHRVIPPEVLDPRAMIPPSKFHFRPGKRVEGLSSPDGDTSRSVFALN
jgi:serine/threonine-protein kinase ULK/ATG1